MSETLALALNPRIVARRYRMSPKMAAIVGHIIGENWTTPRITQMAITSDGHVMAGVDGDPGLNDYLGVVGDLDRNWLDLLDKAELTPAHRAEAEAAYIARITDHRVAS